MCSLHVFCSKVLITFKKREMPQEQEPLILIIMKGIEQKGNIRINFIGDFMLNVEAENT